MFGVKNWNIENITGYKPLTTLYVDFGFAEKFGDYAIRDTYKKMVKEYNILDYKELTELVMVLNWKLWEHYENGNEKLARLYDNLWRESCDYITELLKDDSEKLSYYYRTTD